MRLILAGGGTGGHLFPAIALAEEFMAADPATEILFIGASGGIEERVLPGLGYKLKILNVEAIKNKSGLGRVRSIMKAGLSTLNSIAIIRRFRPDGVIGSGSYASGPVVMAAKLLGVKTAIMEQNVLPGGTNKLLGRFAGRIYLAFEGARKYFPDERTVITGTPVRRDILACARDRGERDKAARKKFTLLVFGGSQGATAINAAFIDAVEYLTDIWSGFRVIHQSGADGYEMVNAAYARKGLKVEVKKFIDDMASAYREADLVICRAGATTLAEITAIGLPAILVPYPFAAGDHQRVNAGFLEGEGAALMLTQDKLTGASLASAIRGLYEDPDAFGKIKEKVLSLGMPEAGRLIVEDYMAL